MTIPTRETTSEAYIANILVNTEATLGQLHHYYKSGRHEGACPERSYFLTSLCGRLLFSLWLTEGESPAGTFDYSPRLGNLIAELDFASLRETEDDKRRRHEEACQGRLRNDPRWFTFWLSMLERQYRNGPSDCRAFYRTTMAYVDRPGFLEGKLCQKKRKALSNFTKTDVAGRLMYQSMLVLDEIVSAMIYRFTRSDQSMHTTERLASLVCLLSQVRRIVVNETPAEGPYVLGANRWGTPSTFAWLFSGRKPGTLRVIPKREGGAVICTYKTAGAKPTKRSWTRALSELKHGYEDELFKTWSYDTGKHHRTPDDADTYAGWQVQYAESKRLRLYFLHVEAVLRTLASNPNYSGLVSEVSNHQNKWMGRMLAWTCIKTLDELLKKLNTAYHETSLLTDSDAQDRIISTKWPPKASPYRQRVDRPNACENACDSASAEPSPQSPPPTTAPQAETERVVAETPAEDSRPQGSAAQAQQRPSNEPAPVDACPPDDLATPTDRMPLPPPEVSATPEENRQGDEVVEERQDPAEPSQDNASTLAVSPTGEPEHEPTPEESASPAPETATAADQPAVSGAAPQGLLESPDENAQDEASAEPNASCQSGESVPEPTPPRNQPQVDDRGPLLTQTLLQRHRPANGPANYTPMSQNQLQQELGCTRTELQRTMKRIFGPKPFAVYRSKCKKKTIGDVLEALGHDPAEPQNGRTDDPDRQTSIAEMASDQSLCEQIAQSTPRKCQSRQDAYRNRSKHKRQRT